MEKQKIFWVILSVTVFVVVVLVVGVFLLKKDSTALTASPASPSTTPGGGIYEFGREAGGDTEVLHFTIGGEAGTETGTAADAGTPAAGPSTEPSTAASSSTAAPPTAVPPAAVPTATKPAASTPGAATTPKPATTATTAKPSATAYWIQTGSYKSQTRAEDLSQMLTEKGLAGRVFSFSQARDTYFRVRIGPYANKQEAEKFLAIVRKIQGLEASYISQVPGTRTAN